MNTRATRNVVEKGIVVVSMFLMVAIVSVVGISLMAEAADPTQKVLYVASYDIADTTWGAIILSGIESVFASRNNIELKAVSMETMGLSATEVAQKEQAALEAKALIDSWKPALVITSDDDAAKYLIVPHFKDADLPFVFCGVNWDASKYGFPAKNVTGMLEVQLVDQIVAYLTPYAKGTRIGSLRADTMTHRAEADYFKTHLGVDITTYFVDNIADWKTRFVQLQDEVDLILLGDIGAVKTREGTSPAELEQFMVAQTKVPTGRWDVEYKTDALITIANIPKEQGEYAAQAALQILDGKSPADIPLVKNKKAEIYLNMKLAKKLGVRFPIELVEHAELISGNE